jgi:hypothetical protein
MAVAKKPETVLVNVMDRGNLSGATACPLTRIIDLVRAVISKAERHVSERVLGMSSLPSLDQALLRDECGSLTGVSVQMFQRPHLQETILVNLTLYP